MKPVLSICFLFIAVASAQLRNLDQTLRGSAKTVSFTMQSVSAKRELFAYSTCPLPPFLQFLCFLFRKPISSSPSSPGAPVPAAQITVAPVSASKPTAAPIPAPKPTSAPVNSVSTCPIPKVSQWSTFL